MARELDQVGVERRLAVLREIFVAETVDEGRDRLRREASSKEVFAALVARRLEELRALDDLTRYLHATASGS